MNLKIIILVLTFFISSNLVYFTQNVEHKISYDINVASEGEVAKDLLFINHLDFVQMEKFYLKCLDYSFKNIEHHDKIIKDYSYEILSFEHIDNTPFIEKNKDTILYKYINGYQPCLVDNKLYSTFSQIKFDEMGYEMYDDFGNPIFEEIINLDEIHKVANKIRFNEKWSYSSEGKFIKTIDAIQFRAENIYEEFYLITPEVLINNEKPTDIVFFKNVSYDVLFDSNPMNEYSDLPYLNNLSIESKKNLINPIFENLLSGELEIYSPFGFDVEGQFNQISKESYTDYLSNTHEVEIFDPETFEFMLDNNGDYKTETVRDYYRNIDIIGFHFVEDWHLDLKTNSFVKKVKYYGPIVNVIDNYSGESLGNKLLFLIKN